MNEITKVSEITEKELANYLRISEVSEQEKTELKTYCQKLYFKLYRHT